MGKKVLVVAATVGMLVAAQSVNGGQGPGQGSGAAPVNIVSPLPLPVTGSVEVARNGIERVSFESFVSLETGVFSDEQNASVYDVPAGKVLVIENVQYDTNAACFYKYQPTVRVDRPVPNGVEFDRYSLAIVVPEAFSSGGAAFLSAATHLVSINAPPLGSVRFGFFRSIATCFGQIRFRVDGRLEKAP